MVAPSTSIVDLCEVVSGLGLSPEAERTMSSYSDDLLDALINAICSETMKRGARRISENDVLKSVKTISRFPARVVPRTMLKIFKAHSNSEPVDAAHPQPETATGEPFLQKNTYARKPRKPLIDEAEFLEDIRKMKPKDPREPQTYYSHKLTLEPHELLPRLGAAAIAEATAAFERPARHFVGRPQPLITEDRGNVQPELTTYNRYRDYLGIVGPMPNVKPNIGPLTKVPAYLQALQQRNEMLGLLSNGSNKRPSALPAQAVPMERSVQDPMLNSGPAQMPYQQPLPHQVFQVPASHRTIVSTRQSFQGMSSRDNRSMYQNLLQEQRSQKWVDEVERSALLSPTPPLSECDYPLHNDIEPYHFAFSRKGDVMALSLTNRPEEMGKEPSSCTRSMTPPDLYAIEIPEGPVDHVDCAEYYEKANKELKTKSNASGRKKCLKNDVQRAQEVRQGDANLAQRRRGSTKQIVVPKPPSHLTAKEAILFEKWVRKFELIALDGRVDRA